MLIAPLDLSRLSHACCRLTSASAADAGEASRTPGAKQAGQLLGARQSGVVLEEQVEAPGHREEALEHGAQLKPLRVAAPAIEDVMVIPHHHLRT